MCYFRLEYVVCAPDWPAVHCLAPDLAVHRGTAVDCRAAALAIAVAVAAAAAAVDCRPPTFCLHSGTHALLTAPNNLLNYRIYSSEMIVNESETPH